ncbi:MAG: hypothetical protein AAFY28_15650 [Actinomycetota bacterium]
MSAAVTEPSASSNSSDVLRLLLSREIDDVLSEYLHCSGHQLVSARPCQIVYRPAGATTAQYRIRTQTPTGDSALDTLVVAVGGEVVQGATALRNDSTTVNIWGWRNDPALPGLAAAVDRQRVRDLFRDIGCDGSDVQLRARAYRPGRRAVVEADNGHQRLFLKVVRPDRVEVLHHAHRQLAESMPVPDSLGWTNSGVMVLPAISGSTLREALRRGDKRLPDPAAIEHLLERIPSGVGRRRTRAPWLDEAQRHADLVKATVPGTGRVVTRALHRLEDVHARLSGGSDVHETVTVHGDLYEAQILVDGTDIVGLLDVDTVGVGQRIDDIANFCAHLSVLATVWPNPRSVNRYGGALLNAAERRFRRPALRARIAAATLGLATGPFRSLEANWVANTHARIRLAERWLDGAERPSCA